MNFRPVTLDASPSERSAGIASWRRESSAFADRFVAWVGSDHEPLKRTELVIYGGGQWYIDHGLKIVASGRETSTALARKRILLVFAAMTCKVEEGET